MATATLCVCATSVPARADGVADLERAQALLKANDCAAASPILEGVASAFDAALAAKALHALASCAVEQSRYASAIAYLVKGVELSRDVNGDEVREMRELLVECYVANRDGTAAEPLVEQLVKQSPDRASIVHYNAGKRYLWRDQYAQAIAHLELAQKLNKQAANAKETRLIRRQLMDSYLGAGDARWEDLLQEMLRAYPKAACDLYYVVGRRYESMHCPAASATWIRKALEISTAAKNSPNTKNMQTLLMQDYHAMSDFTKERAQLQLLLRDYPEDEKRWRNALAWSYADAEESERAIPMFEDVISRFPEYTGKALVGLANAMCRTGRAEEAIARLNAYYKDKPDMRAAYTLALGQCLYVGRRDFKGAAAKLEEFIAQFPADPGVTKARKLLVAIYAALQLPHEASDAIDALIATASVTERADLLMQKGEVYFTSGKLQEAATAYRAVANTKCASVDCVARAAYQLALCYHSSGLTNSATAYMRRVAEKYPATEAAKQARGMLYLWEEQASIGLVTE